MIIGGGLLARSFASRFGDDPEVTVFASGVSNSLESRAPEFEREHALLSDVLARNPCRLVYFGSCGVTGQPDDLTPYMRHKQRMEAMVLASDDGLVLRLPQVVSHTDNPHTLTNFLHERILSGQSFTVWARAQRNLIDIDDIVAIGTSLIAGSKLPSRTIAIASSWSLPMPEIVSIFERILRKQARYTVEDRGSPLSIDTTVAVAEAGKLGIDFGPGYVDRILRKYYSPGHYA